MQEYNISTELTNIHGKLTNMEPQNCIIKMY